MKTTTSLAAAAVFAASSLAHRLGMLALLSGVALNATPVGAQTSAQAPITESPAKHKFGAPVDRNKWTGDFDGMIKRRMIRVLVPYSKTYYFVDRAVQRGISYDVTRLLEADLNKKLRTGRIRLSVICVPVNRGEMIPGLLEGRGDIAMGNLTITPERLKQVDFTQPFMRNAVEIAITGPGAEPLATAEDLSGKEVYVPASSRSPSSRITSPPSGSRSSPSSPPTRV